ncbi:Cleavage stimulation factor subunit 3 [Bagarius yarrelli]|uniref:Cleavage stimulation factor subunit 3 n=1 Tax=Bagarius yarrelli TaxID=175774 RepID=A0A556VBK7_BAGYA|nr:Cleavage stimulation factor subunit 3 [Bagarius yarrelli]
MHLRVLCNACLMNREIWARFLAFESNIGDLASILKVERRRFLAFKEEYDGKETALLDVSRAKYASLIQETVVTPSAPALKDDGDRKPEYPKPDTQQMIPFQPRHLAPPGLHPVPGGVFPVPPAAMILMKLLPPPNCFTVSISAGRYSRLYCYRGINYFFFFLFPPRRVPFVQVDELIETFRRCTLPETVEAAVELITGSRGDVSGEGNGPVENHTLTNKSLKRPNADSDEEEEKGSIAPPVNDIYRARQQKRIR